MLVAGYVGALSVTSWMIGMAKQTFNYATRNVQGGQARRPTSLGPRKTITEWRGTRSVSVGPQPVPHNTGQDATIYAEYVRSLTARVPMPEAELVQKTAVRPDGHYVSRERGVMRWSDFKKNLLARSIAAIAPPAETTEEWLRRHKIGEYA